MRYAARHDPLTETVSITLEANCFLDSAPLVPVLEFHNAAFDTAGPEMALACAILTRAFCGDVFELEDVAITPDLAEAIRTILPQTPNVGPVNGMNRALWAGSIEVFAAPAGTAGGPHGGASGLPVMQVDWSGDFVDPGTLSGAGHRYGRYLTNAGLVADPVEVSIAVALLHAGAQCRRIAVPLGERDPACYLPIARALAIMSITLELVETPDRAGRSATAATPEPPPVAIPLDIDVVAPADWNTVWLYWENRYAERMPAYLELCLETIRAHAGAARVVLVAPETLERWIAPATVPARYAALSPNHRSDYLRIRLLHDHGGMWIDIDTVVFRSLSEHVLTRLDEAELVSPGPRFAQQIFASRPRGAFVREALTALETRLADDSPIGWNGLGSELIYPIAARHACAGVAMSGWLHHWQDWRKYLEPGDFDDDGDRLACSLYNKFMFEPLKDVTRSELLCRDWLVSKLLRRALAL